MSSSRLEALRSVIRTIERRPPSMEVVTAGLPQGLSRQRFGAPGGADWRVGDPRLDGLAGGALEIGAVHEVKPVAGRDWSAANAAARRFVIGLALRRLGACGPGRQHAPVLWCMSMRRAGEAGRPYGPGLAALGFDPSRLVLVEPPRESDVLWAAEEGLKSGAPALVVAEVHDIGLTPARRLALAAAASGTPCLLVTDGAVEGAASTATRWRIGPAPSAPHPFDPQAPGAHRCSVILERCRTQKTLSGHPVILEWDFGWGPCAAHGCDGTAGFDREHGLGGIDRTFDHPRGDHPRGDHPRGAHPPELRLAM